MRTPTGAATPKPTERKAPCKANRTSAFFTTSPSRTCASPIGRQAQPTASTCWVSCCPPATGGARAMQRSWPSAAWTTPTARPATPRVAVRGPPERGDRRGVTHARDAGVGDGAKTGAGGCRLVALVLHCGHAQTLQLLGVELRGRGVALQRGRPRRLLAKSTGKPMWG